MKKRKKNALSMVELLIIIGIMGILATMLTIVIVPKYQNSSKFSHIKATLFNIQKVNSHLLGQRREEGNWTQDNITNYCKMFADSITTKGDIECQPKENDNINFTFPTNVAIKGLIGDWETPNDDIKHPYKNINFIINNNNEKKRQKYDIRIFKDEPYVIPLDTLLTEDKNLKYAVVQKREEQNGTYIDTYKLIKKNVSFQEAACITGLDLEFMQQKERTTCTKESGRYFDYDIFIADIPKAVNILNKK